MQFYGFEGGLMVQTPLIFPAPIGSTLPSFDGEIGDCLCIDSMEWHDWLAIEDF
jgi:hypothetical protein